MRVLELCCLRNHLYFLLVAWTTSFNLHLSGQVLLNGKNQNQLLKILGIILEKLP